MKSYMETKLKKVKEILEGETHTEPKFPEPQCICKEGGINKNKVCNESYETKIAEAAKRTITLLDETKNDCHKILENFEKREQEEKEKLRQIREDRRQDKGTITPVPYVPKKDSATSSEDSPKRSTAVGKDSPVRPSMVSTASMTDRDKFKDTPSITDEEDDLKDSSDQTIESESESSARLRKQMYAMKGFFSNNLFVIMTVVLAIVVFSMLISLLVILVQTLTGCCGAS